MKFLKPYKLILVVGFVLLFSTSSFAQEGKFKALYIYNFTKYMKWPESKESGDFIIGVVGASDVNDALIQLSKAKKVQDVRTIIIKQFGSSEDVTSDCHIVYLSPSLSKELPIIVKKTYPNNILLVTDYKGFASKGSCVNFVMEDNFQKFEISQKHTKMAGIQVAATFLKLAIVVD